MQRTLDVRQVVIDSGAAAALCLADLLVSFDRGDPQARSLALTATYAVAGYLLLSVRRRWPGAVFTALLGHALVSELIVPGYLPTLGLWLALYTLASRCERRAASLGLVAMSGPTALTVLDELRRHSGGTRIAAAGSAVVLSSGVAVLLFGAGRWVRWNARRQHLAAEQSAAEAASAERNRIAREMHDIVAHSVTLMILHAAGAARWLRYDADTAEAALAQVDVLGQQAVGELRRLLDLLDPDQLGAPPGPPSWLGEVTGLVEEGRAVGLDIDFTVSGTPGSLDQRTGRVAYRALQEAMTNLARYADRGRQARVAMLWHPSHVRLEVTNYCSPGPQPDLSTGRGLTGLRERVLSCGGSVVAGPQPDGRFVLDVALPLVPPLTPPLVPPLPPLPPLVPLVPPSAAAPAEGPAPAPPARERCSS